MGSDSRVSRILANEKPSFENPASIAPVFKMAESEVQAVDESNIEPGWSASTTRILIEFYAKSPALWNKAHNRPLLEKSQAPNTEEAVKKRWHGLRSTTSRN